MAWFGRLLALFLVVPIAELFLLLWIGGRVGLGPTLALIVTTALVGSWLARREGLATWRRVQERLAAGGLPGRELTDGLIILVSGALLLTPGVLTDAAGLLGLLPPSRALLRRWAERRFARALASGRANVVVFSGGMGMGSPFEMGAPFGTAPGAPVRPGAPIEDAEVVSDEPAPRSE